MQPQLPPHRLARIKAIAAKFNQDLESTIAHVNRPIGAWVVGQQVDLRMVTGAEVPVGWDEDTFVRAHDRGTIVSIDGDGTHWSHTAIIKLKLRSKLLVKLDRYVACPIRGTEPKSK